MEITFLFLYLPEMAKTCSFLEVQRGQIVVFYNKSHTKRKFGDQIGCIKIVMHQAIMKFKKSGTYADAKPSVCALKTTLRTDILTKKKV